MASKNESELDDEVRELLENYKFKKATVYEPCTNKNIKECLIGLAEELELLNINYVFNPYFDVTTATSGQTLHPEALVKLVNTIWTILHYHKAATEKAEKLVEQNHVLEQLNKQLNRTAGLLNEKVNAEKYESRTCTAAARKISDQSDGINQSLAETKAKFTQVKKQKETMENNLRHEITRLKIENEKLSDRLRSKSGSFTPCSKVCDSTVLQLKEREKRQHALICKLQRNAQELMKEVIQMKEKIILHGIK